MVDFTTNSDPRVATIFESYPTGVQSKMYTLRNIIIDEARKTASITSLEETLKWGEPSYINKNGNTIRMDWKAKSPDQYALYFQCTSLLVPTFKMVYGNILKI